jgi:RNA polymerase sigma factor (sigma-70 family)
MPSPASDSKVTDGALVAACQRGERGAFVRIVQRHQALVCAVAWQGTGDFAASEDVAQETFVTAWKKMSSLREPDKLRGWLTQIARTQAAEWRRKNRSNKTVGSVGSDISPDHAPDAAAVSAEEAALVWQALASLPEAARLPLILFYREGQSIAAVATALEISEAAVKQRLSRGREVLRERLAGLAESVLQRTQPGALFTFAVMAAVGALAPPAAVAATAFTVSSNATVATGVAAPSLTPTAAFMSLTQLTVAASIAFLLPVVWPAPAASRSDDTTVAPALNKATTNGVNSAIAPRPANAPATEKETTSLGRLASLLKRLTVEQPALERALLTLECRDLIMRLPLAQMQPALALMVAVPRHDDAAPMVSTLFARWAQHDPRGAYAAAIALQPNRNAPDANDPLSLLKGVALQGFINEWSRRDHAAALAFLEELPDELVQFSMRTVGTRVFAETRPQEALKEWLKIGRDSGVNTPDDVLLLWARRDPRAAWAWLKAQPGEAHPLMSPRHVLYQLTFSNPALVLEFSRDLPPGENRSGLVWNTLGSLAKQDPAAAVEALFHLTPDDIGTTPLTQIAESVVTWAPARVAEALPRWTDPTEREQMTAVVCRHLAAKDRARAEALVATISDAKLRESVLKAINES